MVHVAWPVAELYLPATHATHAAEDVEPALGFAVPAVQFVHAAWPVAELYVPATQLRHALADVDPVFGL